MASSRVRPRAGATDRDRAVDLINGAYAGAELTAEQRDARVTRALKATTLRQLRSLTEDLRGVRPDDFTPEVHPEPNVPQHPSPRRGSTRWRSKATAGLIGAGAVVALLAGGAWIDSRNDGLGPDAEPMQNRAGLSEFVEEYERDFGTSRTYAAIISDNHARVLVPEPDQPGRFVHHGYQGGEFSRNQGGTTSEETTTVDLARVDIERLVANIRRATTELGDHVVAEETLVTVAGTSGEGVYAAALGYPSQTASVPPHVEIRVQNEYQEWGLLVTDLSGSVLAEVPIGQDLHTAIGSAP